MAIRRSFVGGCVASCLAVAAAIGRAAAFQPLPPSRLRTGLASGNDDVGDPAAGSTSPPASAALIVVDVENVRGASSFRISHESLLHRAAAWRSVRGGGPASAEGLAMVFDHGSARTAHSGGPLADGLAAVFAGPDRTADDVIVSLVGERCGGVVGSGAGDEAAVVVVWADNGTGTAAARNATVVVTADAGLIARCQRARRESSTLSEVVFVEPASFLNELEAHASEADELSFFGIADSSAAATSVAKVEGLAKDGISAEKVRAGSAEVAEVDARESTKVDEGNVNEDDDGNEIDHDADLAFVRKEDADFALQRTVELQRRLLRDMNAKIGPRRKGKANKRNGQKAKGGVISARKRSKLLATRHRLRKKADMTEAFKRRQVLAERLRRKLSAAPGALTAESVPIYRLLEWLSVPSGGDGGSAGGAAMAPPPLLTYSAGEDAAAGKAGPLSSVLTVPLRDGNGRDDTPDGGNTAPPPLRLVIISDTHGFEKSLLKLPPPGGLGEDFPPGAVRPDYPVLPRADVLIHCGDFASNGSRARQRESIRKIDAFLAAQRHIPEKIVVRGNHDPETPGRVLFPKSRALYATSSKVLIVNGVRFALEPYSRRAARGIVPRAGGGGPVLPECDVLVSHEPPRGVLDLTYSGMRAGSTYLRRAVEKSKTKPRCWLCGHIHEGRGAAKEVFAEGGAGATAAANLGGEGETTLVVNAANANYGKANRLVAGAVVVDVEREFATTEVTRIEEEDPPGRGISDGGGDPRSAVGDLGLELREMRPGVRRRKGLSAARRRAGQR